jgi:NAD+ dependent glucose-6-phosphate dehydrogenase
MSNIVLITGATGSIGRKIRRHLADQDVPLRLLCLNPVRDPQVETADLSRYDDAWARQFDGAEAVIHLAGDPYATASWESVQRNNIDLTLNVLRAAQRHRVNRIVFASSNWVMAGYRFSAERLTTDLPPKPVNAYGSAKLLCERVGRELADQTEVSFIALRIGCCQHVPGNRPGPQIEHGIWGQQMWLSDRDLCNGLERATFARNVPFAILNLMSDNPGMRWDIEETRRVIGYAPRDGHVAVMTPAIEKAERLARSAFALGVECARIAASG